MRRLNPSASIFIGFGCLFSAGSALAQSECDTDTDCDEGFVCNVVGMSGCAGAACPEDSPDCDPEPVDCEPEEFRMCEPGPCESDDQCGADMVCETREWSDCGAVSETCDTEGNCTETKPDECETGSVSECVYKWQTACQVDSDCGAGFTCAEVERGCACSGGAEGEPMPADGGAAPAGDPQDLPAEGEQDPAGAAECECESTTEHFCKADEIVCEADADCPSSWTCEAPPRAACGGGSMVDGDSGGTEDDNTGDAEGSSEGSSGGEADRTLPPPEENDPPEQNDPPEAGEPCMTEVEPTMHCVPPGYGYDLDTPSRGSDDGAVGDPSTGEGDPTTVPSDEVDSDDAEEEPDGNTNGAPSQEDDDAAEGEDEEDDSSEDEEDDSSEDDDDGASTDSDTSDDGGCSVAARGGSNAMGAAWLLALSFGLLRRRRGASLRRA